MDDLKIICLQSEAFYHLVNEVVAYVKKGQNITEDSWVSQDEAMKLLGIKAKSTLQKFRDEGRIRYSKSTNKNILYYRPSIIEYLKTKSEETF